jgi:hypothetical protein
VEVDGTVGGLGVEVGSDGAEAERLRTGGHCDDMLLVMFEGFRMYGKNKVKEK